MFYLLLAIISSVMISFIMRYIESRVQNQMGMFMMNYLVCAILACMFMQNVPWVTLQTMTIKDSLLGIVTGFMYLYSFVAMKANMKHNGVMLTTIFMKLGVLLPTIMAVVVFHETLSGLQLIGFVLAIFAIILINFEKGELHSGGKKALLFVSLFLSGMCDAMSNVFEQMGTPINKDGFLFATFAAACLVAMLNMFKEKNKMTKKDALYGIVIGIPNYFSARFILLSLGQMPAVLVYPTFSVSTIVVIAFVSLVVFKEKLSVKKLFAIGIIALALCLLNL